jgi:hypothetical protein
VLAEFIDEICVGSREQVAWAQCGPRSARTLSPHEARLREDAWSKIADDADRAEWERLGLRN